MAGWLPAGWTVEVKVRKSGRKDKYYIDPISGYAFRSSRDVFRYLESGDKGRRAAKPKDKSSSDGEKEHRITSAQTSHGPMSQERRLNGGHASKQCEESAGLRSLNSPATNYFGPDEERRDPPKSVVIFLPAYKPPKPKQPLGKGVGTHLGQHESKNKSETRLPQQAPKLLVRLEPNPMSELKASNDQPCQAVEAGTERREEGEEVGSPHALPFGDSWSDPCIEFAIKTLTGAIPVEEHVSTEDIFQK